MTLRFSIVTPSYNQAAFLDRTIRSVVSQSHRPYEYYVIDGASNDGSRDVIRVYEASLSGWVSEPDRGQGEAINKGFARASGDIFAWINSDDFYLRGAFERVSAFFEARPDVDFVYGDVLSIDRDGALMNVMRFAPYGWRDLASFRIIGQPAVFFRRSLWEKSGGLDLSYHFLLDHHLWLRMTEGAMIVYLPEPLAAARFYPEAKNRANTADFGKEARRIVDWLLSDGRFRTMSEPIERKIRGGAAWLDANYLSVGRMNAAALRAYARAFTLAPRRVVEDWRRVLLTGLGLVSPRLAEDVFERQASARVEKLAAYKDLLECDSW